MAADCPNPIYEVIILKQQLETEAIEMRNMILKLRIELKLMDP